MGAFDLGLYAMSTRRVPVAADLLPTPISLDRSGFAYRVSVGDAPCAPGRHHTVDPSVSNSRLGNSTSLCIGAGGGGLAAFGTGVGVCEGAVDTARGEAASTAASSIDDRDLRLMLLTNNAFFRVAELAAASFCGQICFEKL